MKWKCLLCITIESVVVKWMSESSEYDYRFFPTVGHYVFHPCVAVHHHNDVMMVETVSASRIVEYCSCETTASQNIRCACTFTWIIFYDYWKASSADKIMSDMDIMECKQCAQIFLFNIYPHVLDHLTAKTQKPWWHEALVCDGLSSQ